MAGKCVMTELGTITHKYWHGSDLYFRQPLDNKTIGTIEFWNGQSWEKAISQARPLPNAANGEPNLPFHDLLHMEGRKAG